MVRKTIPPHKIANDFWSGTHCDQAPESVEDLSSGVDDVSSTADDLSTRADDVETTADDASTKINAVCDAFSVDSGALFDVYASAC